MCCLRAGQFAAPGAIGVALEQVAVRLRCAHGRATAKDASAILAGGGCIALMLRIRAGRLRTDCARDAASVKVGVLAGGGGVFLIEAAAAARPIPVLPLVGSITVPPFLMRPFFSALRSILTATLSLTEPAGLKYSSFV